MAIRRKRSNVSFPARLSLDIHRWSEGDTTKTDPFFILVINNVALERPIESNNFVVDMATAAKKPLFDKTAKYIKKNLFGEMPGQAEKLLAASPHSAKIRFWSIFVSGATPNDASALVGEDRLLGSRYVLPRRDAVVRMMASIGLNPDIVFLVTNSSTHDQAHAWGTTDDDSRSGIRALYDGRTIFHRFYHKIPGTVALHTSNGKMTAAHEFGHAFSSYTNGFITDLYRDGDAQFNRKVGRPIPNNFGSYQGNTFKSDKTRGPLGGYEPELRTTFHPELMDPAQPALMDNFHDGGMLSVHDKITKAYIMDRIAAKVSR